MDNMTNQKTKKILLIVANVLVWVFLALSVLTTILVFTAQGSEDGVPAVFGKSLVSVATNSMEGTFDPGDLILLEKLPDKDSKRNLEIGTIITYHAPIDLDGDGVVGDINTHRIVDYDGNSYITQGDNNPLRDNEGDHPYVVPFNNVIGVVGEDDGIAGLGGVIAFLRSSLGFLLCIVLPLGLFFLYELYRFVTIVLAERAERAAGMAESEEEIKRRAIEEYLRQQAAAAAAAAAATPAADADAPAEEEAVDTAEEPAEEPAAEEESGDSADEGSDENE